MAFLLMVSLSTETKIIVGKVNANLKSVKKTGDYTRKRAPEAPDCNGGSLFETE